jgi:Gpi18-like mannosyltransferase
LVAALACTTRATGMFLAIPFIFEYLRQRQFNWRKIDWQVLSCGIAFLGFLPSIWIGYSHFHDPLAFQHAESSWNRVLSLPWVGYARSFSLVGAYPLISYISIHQIMEIIPGFVILVALILTFVGPWRLSSAQRVYGIYGCVLFLVFVINPLTAPVTGDITPGFFPLTSLSRYVLEIFPAFVLFGAMGAKRNFNIFYLSITLPLLTFWVLQWLLGGMIV